MQPIFCLHPKMKIWTAAFGWPECGRGSDEPDVDWPLSMSNFEVIFQSLLGDNEKILLHRGSEKKFAS